MRAAQSWNEIPGSTLSILKPKKGSVAVIRGADQSRTGNTFAGKWVGPACGN
jgi:hypothetical protein